jgi:hypothetical protein
MCPSSVLDKRSNGATGETPPALMAHDRAVPSQPGPNMDSISAPSYIQMTIPSNQSIVDDMVPEDPTSLAEMLESRKPDTADPPIDIHGKYTSTEQVLFATLLMNFDCRDFGC